MGFRQKQRGIKIRFWESIALVLLALTLASGVGWWLRSQSADWVLAPARIHGVSLVENTHAIEASRPAMRIHFDYLVEGRIYQGSTRFDRVTRVVYGALPVEIRDLLRSKGYLSFKDLPPDIQSLLRNKGLTSFDKIPPSVLDALRAQGYNSVHEFPADVEQLLADGHYAQAANIAGFSKETLAALNAADKRTTRLTGTGGSVSHETRPVHIMSGATVKVRYDPASPSRYEVVKIPFLDNLLNVGIFVGLMVITMVYCAVIYPRVKQR